MLQERNSFPYVYDILTEEDMFKDPVCGMMVDEKTAQHKSDIEGKTVFLCSAGCKTQFESNLKKYGY